MKSKNSINLKNKTYIIAEVGVNHNGSITLAKKIILGAKKSGADCVKFQIFDSGKLVTKNAPKAEYQIKNTKNKENQFKMLKSLELKKKDYLNLMSYCKKLKIDFLLSVFDEDSLIFAQRKINLKQIKIPSGELNNYFLLDKIDKKTFIIMSSGMSTINEIAKSINRIFKKEIYKIKNKISINQNLLKTIKEKIIVLHCVTDYPVDMKYANIDAISYLRNILQINIGYSDHTAGIIAPALAVAKGAKMIEKHITLSKKMKGPDHKASLDLDEFKKMVKLIRDTELMLGNGFKKIEKCEVKNMEISKKSIVAKINIKKGEYFSFKNITAKRPFNGISPDNIDNYLNKKSKMNLKKDEKVI